MLAVQGSNPIGNVLHVITGPETALFTDIHGAAIMDITALLANMDQNKRVFLSLTRCQHEPVTEQMIKATGMNVLCSFNDKSSVVDTIRRSTEGIPTEGVPTATANGAVKPPAQQATKKRKASSERCDYCGEKLKLLPIPGVKICTTCAQIEIGRKGQPKDTSDASPTDQSD